MDVLDVDSYTKGYREGFAECLRQARRDIGRDFGKVKPLRSKKKRKLSAWNKYVKANSNKPRFRYRSGKLNLKKMAVAFRKTPAGRKKRR